jgi:hypothetical protein
VLPAVGRMLGVPAMLTARGRFKLALIGGLMACVLASSAIATPMSAESVAEPSDCSNTWCIADETFCVYSGATECYMDSRGCAGSILCWP